MKAEIFSPIPKNIILEGKTAQINDLSSQEKLIFLGNTFAILSDPNPLSQDQRDAALDLLRSVDLKKFNPEGLRESYLRAVSILKETLNQDSDPYGEIHMLLEAGKIIAPFIKNRSGITRTWKIIARAFEGSDRKKILNDIKEIRQLIPKTFSEFDTNVAMYIKEGLPNQDIAAKLGVTTREIENSVSRLRSKGMRFNRRTGRKRTAQ